MKILDKGAFIQMPAADRGVVDEINEEKKQVYVDKITNRLSGKSLETLKTLRRLYDIMTNLD